jgi:hypothetical protein
MLCRHAEVRVDYDRRRLLYSIQVHVRKQWCFSTRMAKFDDYDARRMQLSEMISHPQLSIYMLCPTFPEKIARHVAAMERVLEKDQIRVRFANGHHVDIDMYREGDKALSEYDHANLLMVYDLPPR